MNERYPWALRVEKWPDETPLRGWGFSRAEWGEGPWQDEPDKIEWRHASGMPLLITRGGSGALCGYVGLPATHPYFARDYDRVHEDSSHGGLTFSGTCGGHICHEPAPSEPEEVWWLGFDCGHHNDVSPGLEVYLRQARSRMPISMFDGLVGEYERLMGKAYRDVAHVRAHVEALAGELSERGPMQAGRERWYWPMVAQAKLFLFRDFPAMWRAIYLERNRWGFPS